MEYWRGQMNWPLDLGWQCEICDSNVGLEWGFVHSECRCNYCHSPYWMRDNSKDSNPIVSRPISGIKDEYKGAVRQAINALSKKFEELTQEDIEEFSPQRERI